MDYIQTMIAGVFRLILIAFVFYLVFLFIRIYIMLTRRRKSSPRPRPIQGRMVKDEICNTYVPKEEALREVRSGREHFFCSQECRRKFLEHRDSPPPASQ